MIVRDSGEEEDSLEFLSIKDRYFNVQATDMIRVAICADGQENDIPDKSSQNHILLLTAVLSRFQ